MCDNRIPTALWVEARLRDLNAQGIAYYIVNKGAYAAGTVLVKINAREQGCQVFIQQRDLDGNLDWSPVLGEAPLGEARADDYIKRALSRDPDLWVVEIESKLLSNPFNNINI